MGTSSSPETTVALAAVVTAGSTSTAKAKGPLTTTTSRSSEVSPSCSPSSAAEEKAVRKGSDESPYDGSSTEQGLSPAEKSQKQAEDAIAAALQQVATSNDIAKSSTPWQKLNKSIRNTVFYEDKRPMTWREEWLGIHLPPSTIASRRRRTGKTSRHGTLSTLDNYEEETNHNNDDCEEDGEPNSDEDAKTAVGEDFFSSNPPRKSLHNFVTFPSSPADDVIAQQRLVVPPPSPTATSNYSLSSLLLSLASSGPSIPLYPLLFLLTTIYLIQKIILQPCHRHFNYKNRIKIRRSMQHLLSSYNQNYFVITQEELVKHMDWMKKRSDLRRKKERIRRGGDDYEGSSTFSSGDDDKGGGGGGDDRSGRGGGGHQHDANNNNNGGRGGHINSDDNNRGNNNYNSNTSNQNSKSNNNDDKNNLVLSNNDDKKSYHQWTIDQEKLHKAMEKVEELKTDNICANEKIVMLKEQLVELTKKRNIEVMQLKSQIDVIEQSIRESNEKAYSFENECKELKEKNLLLQEEVDVLLERVCEKICSTSSSCSEEEEGDGVEIIEEGTNSSCLRSNNYLGCLTNNEDEQDDDSLSSSDSEWDRLEEENKLLRAENELLHESMDSLRKELHNVTTNKDPGASSLTPLKLRKNADVSPSLMNDLTVEMTDESFEGVRRSGEITPLFVEGKEHVMTFETPLSSLQAIDTEGGEEGTEAENTVRLLLKCAYSARRITKNNGKVSKGLNRDLLQLMANLRKFDGDHRTKESTVCGCDARGRGSNGRHRTSHKDLSKMMVNSQSKPRTERALSRKGDKSTKKLDQWKTDDICADESMLMLKEQLAEVTKKKDAEIALLQSQLAVTEQAVRESNEKAYSFENECKGLKEKIELLQEEVDVLELVCEKMCPSGEGDNGLEGLEIEEVNCLRSHLGSLTNIDEHYDDSNASFDSEWNRLEEENKLLMAQNELFQKTIESLRKDLERTSNQQSCLTRPSTLPLASNKVASNITMVLNKDSTSSVDGVSMFSSVEAFACSDLFHEEATQRVQNIGDEATEETSQGSQVTDDVDVAPMVVSITVISLHGLVTKKYKPMSKLPIKQKKKNQTQVDTAANIVASFSQHYSKDKEFFTHLPSLPIEIVHISSKPRLYPIVSWPGNADESVEKLGQILSTLRFSRRFRHEAVDTSSAARRFVPQTFSINISVSRHGKIIVLGTANVIISGDEKGESSTIVPISSTYKRKGVSSPKRKSSSTDSIPMIRIKGDDLQFGLKVDSILRVLISVAEAGAKNGFSCNEVTNDN